MIITLKQHQNTSTYTWRVLLSAWHLNCTFSKCNGYTKLTVTVPREQTASCRRVICTRLCTSEQTYTHTYSKQCRWLDTGTVAQHRQLLVTCTHTQQCCSYTFESQISSTLHPGNLMNIQYTSIKFLFHIKHTTTCACTLLTLCIPKVDTISWLV